MSKLTRTKKREIRDQVRAIVIRKLKQINLAGFSADLGVGETEYANQFLTDTITSLRPVELVRIEEVLREQGVPEHHVEERALILWERSKGTEE